MDTSTVVDTAANESLAREISESLLEADSLKGYFDGLSESEKEVFTAYSTPATTTTDVQ